MRAWAWSIRTYVVLAVLADIGVCVSPTVDAQTYPSRSVRLISPFPGGTSDLVARILKDRLSDVWQSPVIVENRTGAGGNIGSDSVAKSPPDGYTLLSTTGAPIVVNPFLYSKLPYDPEKDFVPIVLLTTTSNVLFVNKAVPATTLAELIALAKAQPKQLTYASGGYGTSPHLMAEMLKTAAGIEMLHVPYRSVSDLTLSVVSGQTDVAFGPPPMMEYVTNGSLKALAQTGSKRLPTLPAIPTLQESGLKAFYAVVWYGLLAPTGTPQAVLDKIERDVQKVLTEPDTRAKIQGLGADILSLGQKDFAQFISDDRNRWREVVKVSGAKID